MSRPFSAENVFRALGHPTRRRILEAIRTNSPRTPADLLLGGHLSGGTLSDHLRILRQAALLSCHRRGTRLEYRINYSALREASGWLAQFEKRADRRPRKP